jgi:magnesium-transporting ATPase (P-type)
VWVLTGDKMETAINIGYSCRLLTSRMVLIKVLDRGDAASVHAQLRKLVQHFERYVHAALSTEAQPALAYQHHLFS